ncbi:MAG: hypothetical protein II627_08725, partial [Lachnospiraceae bacterium]|nr:hypothetical protein [Lachnospiraceae bacterium]
MPAYPFKLLPAACLSAAASCLSSFPENPNLFGGLLKNPQLSAFRSGSASIGQVYKAKLTDGSEVAVKVQKPGSYETVVLDLSILKKLCYAADKYITRTRTFNLPAIMSEFERSILKELDYMEEVMNIQKITKNFEDEDYVKFPKVYTDICSPKL